MKRLIALAGIVGFVSVCYFWNYYLTEHGDFLMFAKLMSSPSDPEAADTVPHDSFQTLKYSFINKSGKPAFPGSFDAAGSFHDGCAAVKIGEKWGFIDHSGALKIPAKYLLVRRFSSGLAPVLTDDSWEYIDPSGAVVVPPNKKWISVEKFERNIASVEDVHKNFRVINRSGAYVIPVDFTRIDDVHDSACRVVTAAKQYGYISTDGSVISSPQFEDGRDFSEGLAAVCKHGKWGYIDKHGATVIGFQYEQANTFDKGLAVVQLNAKYGLINRSGAMQVPAKYAHLAAVTGVPGTNARFSAEGFTPMLEKSLWGFADNRTGKLVIPAVYYEVSPFSEGVARVGVVDDGVDENNSDDSGDNDKDQAKNADSSDK